MEIKTVELDGARIAYTTETLFKIQVGKGRSAYKTRYAIVGNIHQAVKLYRCINIGNGYKKRIYVESFNKPVLARAFS